MTNVDSGPMVESTLNSYQLAEGNHFNPSSNGDSVNKIAPLDAGNSPDEISEGELLETESISIGFAGQGPVEINEELKEVEEVEAEAEEVEEVVTFEGKLQHNDDVELENDEDPHSFQVDGDEISDKVMHSQVGFGSESRGSDIEGKDYYSEGDDEISDTSVGTILSEDLMENPEISVIELASEDEIENLEDDEFFSNKSEPMEDSGEPMGEPFQEPSKEPMEEPVDNLHSPDQPSEYQEELLNFEDEDEQNYLNNPIQSQLILVLHPSVLGNAELSSDTAKDNASDQLMELTQAEYQRQENEKSREIPTEVLSVEPRHDLDEFQDSEPIVHTPVYITIRDDTYLLAPFTNNQVSDFENLVSLYSWDEVAECTISDFFGLLRQNEDLIDTYNISPKDELKLEFLELNLRVTEDIYHAKSIKLVDIINLYQKLCDQTKLPKSVPGQLTIHVCLQKRFSSQFDQLRQVYFAGNGFEAIIKDDQSEDPIDPDEESVAKKRKLIG